MADLMQQSTLFRNLSLASCTFLFLILSNAHGASENIFKDVLSTPALRMSGALKLEQQPILAVTMVKERIIGVGLRGLIVLSNNGGATWRQAQVPVQSDLTAISFPTQTRGWAVGHDGVILTTSDGGETWVKQLDGLMTATQLPAYYQQRIDAGDTSMQPYLDQAKLNVKTPAALPYLGVYFENEQLGYAVGSFGLIMVTQNGGKTWEPWMHHVDNAQFLNLNDIRQIGSTLYMTGERGVIWKLDKTKQRFNAMLTGYRGSFFSIAGEGDKLLTVGLSGTVFGSSDGGVTWQQVPIGSTSTLTAAIAANGRMVIASQSGEIFTGNDADWKTFRPLPVKRPMMYASGLAVDAAGRTFVTGYRGVQIQTLEPVPTAPKEK